MRYAVGMTTGRASGAAAILLLVTAFAVACTSSTTPATDAGTPAIDAGTPAIDAAISPDGSSPEAAVPDAGFCDPYHLADGEARRRFSAAIGAAIAAAAPAPGCADR